MGVASGNDTQQADAFKKQHRISFPVLPDKTYEIFKAAGVPSIPYMIIVNKEGKVLMNHSGGLEDVDKALKEVREINKQQ